MIDLKFIRDQYLEQLAEDNSRLLKITIKALRMHGVEVSTEQDIINIGRRLVIMSCDGIKTLVLDYYTKPVNILCFTEPRYYDEFDTFRAEFTIEIL